MAKKLLVGAVLVSALGCGGSKPPADASKPAIDSKASEAPDLGAKREPVSESAEKEEVAATVLPTDCAKKDDKVCTPPGAFVTKLCQGSYPSVAIALFAKGTPWTRGYLNRKTKAWNASGGASESDFLEFDEEVLILRKRADDMGGMQVSGAGGGYDALRWNGGCVTLAKEEVTLKLPPKAKNAKVEFRLIDEAMRDVMRQDEKVDAAFKARQKECKGATMGTVSDKCIKADVSLSNKVVDYVRNGGSVGKPERLP